MGQSLIEAALLAANLAHALHINAAGHLPPAAREMALAIENRVYLDQMAAIGCSSAPPCLDPAAGGSCASVAAEGSKLLPDGAALDYGGARWNIQDNYHGWPGEAGSIAILADGTVSIAARPGDRGWFDPPRKIRAEFCGRARYAAGEEIRLKFKFKLDPTSKFEGLDWIIIAQVHQADMRYANGDYVEASPPFTLSLVKGPDGEELVVTGETWTGPTRRPAIDPGSGAQAGDASGPKWIRQFAPRRQIGRPAPLSRGEWHDVEFRFRDGHGGTGSVYATLDHVVLADQKAIPTGYAYVDELRDVAFAGGQQLTGSYLKFGLYAGRIAGDPPPEVSVKFYFKDVEVERQPCGAPCP